MERRQAFQFELMPNGEQQRHMSRSAGCARYVYNKALALMQERYEKKEKPPASNWTRCWCRGSRKRPGLQKPHATHYNKPSWTSSVRMPTFSRSEPSSRRFPRRACGTDSESPTQSASNETKSTAAFSCQRSVGCVIATAVRCSARFAV